MRTAVGSVEYPAPVGCICCGRLDADGYVPVGELKFLCYRCIDGLYNERRRNARLEHRMARRQRLLGWRPWPRRACRRM